MQVTPKQFYESICAINDLLVSAHSLRHSFFDNLVNVLTLNLAPSLFTSHYEKVSDVLLAVTRADGLDRKCDGWNGCLIS